MREARAARPGALAAYYDMRAGLAKRKTLMVVAVLLLLLLLLLVLLLLLLLQRPLRLRRLLLRPPSLQGTHVWVAPVALVLDAEEEVRPRLDADGAVSVD